MKAVVQRVSSAAVSVGGNEVSRIGAGMLVLLGVGRNDGPAEADRMANKISKLRIFEDDVGRMNEAVGDRQILCVSQFTLYADTSSGNRPGFKEAASGEEARVLYEDVCNRLGAQKGVFGADMRVEIVNEGPVTILIDV
ncbi:MAG: D-aminoacyl-tRNA deacylase [Solirubrobacterales bacterium]